VTVEDSSQVWDNPPRNVASGVGGDITGGAPGRVPVWEITGLLDGRFDDRPDLQPIARRLRGYRTWSVTSQRMAGENAAEFEGIVTEPAAQARFTATLVRQASGNWKVGTFSGPDPE
jgi:hypothetical protein